MQGRGVAAHAHGEEGIIAVIKAGARTIEHASGSYYVEQEAAELMVKHGVKREYRDKAAVLNTSIEVVSALPM